MRIKLVLRLIVAVVFALVAFIFSDVIPDVPPFSHTFLRVAVTVWCGLIGFGLFPDLAKAVSMTTINLGNSLISRLSDEIISQMMKIPRNPFAPSSTMAMSSHGVVGGVSLSNPLILDTSAIIDGRILDIAKTNFLSGTLLLPTFVLEELQQVADSSDYLKRSRGRRGFEIVSDLKKIKGLRMEVWDKGASGKNVDEKVIKLAKALNGKIITTDFNLNKVATLSNVVVLNVNDLANAVKTAALPGEMLAVKVIHLGKDSTQGVGYFPDGTMIVVEKGSELVGKTIQAEVTRVLQGSAGRMVFSKPLLAKAKSASK